MTSFGVPAQISAKVDILSIETSYCVRINVLRNVFLWQDIMILLNQDGPLDVVDILNREQTQ